MNKFGYRMIRQLQNDERVTVHDQWGRQHERMGTRGQYYVQYQNYEYGLLTRLDGDLAETEVR